MAEFPEKTISDYYFSIRRAIQNELGSDLCRLLSIDLAHRPTFIRFQHQHDPTTSKDFFNDPAWSSIVDSHIKTVRYMLQYNLQEAFNEKVNSSNELSKLLQAQKETNWCISFMSKHSVDLRRLAIRADAEADIRRQEELARAKGGDGIFKNNFKIMKKDENMERACECLMQLFRVCATDTRSTLINSKRVGMICIINQLFKIYFRINKLHLCKPLIRALDNANIIDQCTLSQKVTYNYYLGVKTLFDLRILDAEKLLDFVFANCHPNSHKNMRLTLIFLIPIKMLLGRMPSLQLLQTYNLCQFDDIKRAVIAGRIGDLDRAIEVHSDFLWRYGIYLIIERLRPIALRNLFKKVAKCANSHLVEMDLILKAVRMVQPEENIQMEEVHCMLSNLIYEGKIKGYLSIGHQKLVLSKTNPFPSIAELVK